MYLNLLYLMSEHMLNIFILLNLLKQKLQLTNALNNNCSGDFQKFPKNYIYLWPFQESIQNIDSQGIQHRYFHKNFYIFQNMYIQEHFWKSMMDDSCDENFLLQFSENYKLNKTEYIQRWKLCEWKGIIKSHFNSLSISHYQKMDLHPVNNI